MNYMFYNCSSLTTLDLSSINTANVTHMSSMFAKCSNLTTVDLSSFNTANVENMYKMFIDCVNLKTIYVGKGWSTAKVSLSDYMFAGCSNLPGYASAIVFDAQMAKLTTAGGFLTYKASGTPVATPATDATNTSLSLTQPAGNVTVRVKYYEQAKFATGGAPAAITGVQASTDNPIVTAGTVKTIGTSSVKMGTVMYYAAQSSSTAPTYDSEGWSEAVPTAATFSEGDVYVWYYIAGAEPASVAARSDDNTCSDSDIKRLTVTLDAAPTYDVVINTAGLSAEEAGKWSASPNTGVKKGDEVTVTYTGTRKVIGVKAQKTGPLYMKWDDSQKALVPTEIPATAIKVEDAEHVFWPAGTYLVEGDVGINGYIELTGDVELIIKDGAKLTAKEIYGEDIYSLSVYGQTNMSGELNLACSFDDAINCMTVLNIHSCKVNASSSEDNNGGFFNILEVNVYGGLVNAEYTGSSNGFGIGSDVMNIYGGEVKAIGKGNDNDYSYGINNSNGTTVNVYGGKLWAECAGNRAINSNVTLTKDSGYTSGKIETSSDGITWTEYTGTDTPDAPYVRVGY
jgi:surface protein